jgi:hypothetical protein
MQHPVHYFEEIRSLTLRLDSLLPGGTDNEEERKPRVYGLCIRADPVYMDSLNLPSSEWRLAREIPASRQSQASRREFAREATTLQTCMSLGKVQDGCASPPMGLSLWHTQSTRKLILIRHDLERMFELDKISSMPYTDERGYFALPGKRQLYFRDCVELIRESHPYLYGICMEYAEMGCSMYGLSMQEFSKVSRLHISTCKSNVGSPLLLQDSLQSRFDGGPIFIGSVGIPVTTYDLTPSLPEADRSAEPCTRVGVREGGLMVLDGDVAGRTNRGDIHTHDTHGQYGADTGGGVRKRDQNEYHVHSAHRRGKGYPPLGFPVSFSHGGAEKHHFGAINPQNTRPRRDRREPCAPRGLRCEQGTVVGGLASLRREKIALQSHGGVVFKAHVSHIVPLRP